MQPLEAAVAPPAFPGAPVAGFVAIGDFGGGPAQGAVAQAMVRWAATHRVDALVTTGDNVYDFGEPQLFDAHLTEPYRELRAGHRPMWVTLGNHDVVRGHGPAQLAYLGLPALPYAAQLLYLFVFGIPMTVVAAFVTGAERPLYPWYAAAPRLFGLTPLADQQLGGIIMWVPAGLIPLVAFTVVFFRWVAAEPDEPEASTPH